MMPALAARLSDLERRLSGAEVAEAELRATVDAVARARDLPFGELLDETRRVLAMTPAEREACVASVIPDQGSEP